jgi:hypothetical protein
MTRKLYNGSFFHLLKKRIVVCILFFSFLFWLHVLYKMTSGMTSNQKSTLNDTQKHQETLQSINQKYCKSDTCRFIVPIAIAEQGKQKSQKIFLPLHVYICNFFFRK